MPPTPPPYTVRLDPDAARAACEAGGTLLLLDVPVGTVVGVDHQSFTTGPKFCGVKMLPPGLHFVAYAASGASDGGGSGGGGGGGGTPGAWFWVDAAPAAVTVRRWCPAHELLLPLDDEDELGRYVAGVRRFDFDSGLAPYNLGGWAAWSALTAHVTPATIARISGPAPNASVIMEADPGGGRPPTAAEAALDAALAAGRAGAATPSAPHSLPATLVAAPVWTRLPRLAPPPPGAPPAAATAANLDKSALLASVIADSYRNDPAALLGELEAAYVAAWAGHSVGGLATWAAGVALALGCTAAAMTTETGTTQAGGLSPAWFGRLLTMLRVQLGISLGEEGGAASDGSLATDVVLDGAFLKRALRGFFEGLADAGGGPPEVQRPADDLRRFLNARLGWRLDVATLGAGDADSGDDSDGPVVVEDAERGW